MIDKHVPLRRCIVTGEQRPKKELIRLVRLGDDKVVVDLTNKVRGRGANITMDLEILEKAFVKKAIEHSLKLKNKLSEDEKIALRDQFQAAIDEKNFRKDKKFVTIEVTKEQLKQALNKS